MAARAGSVWDRKAVWAKRRCVGCVWAGWDVSPAALDGVNVAQSLRRDDPWMSAGAGRSTEGLANETGSLAEKQAGLPS